MHFCQFSLQAFNQDSEETEILTKYECIQFILNSSLYIHSPKEYFLLKHKKYLFFKPINFLQTCYSNNSLKASDHVEVVAISIKMINVVLKFAKNISIMVW